MAFISSKKKKKKKLFQMSFYFLVRDSKENSLLLSNENINIIQFFFTSEIVIRMNHNLLHGN